MFSGNFRLPNLSLFKTIHDTDEGLPFQCFFVCTAATDITFPDALANLTVIEGDQTTLTCTALGVPAPEFMWYRGSELINGLDTRLQVSSSDPMINVTTGFVYTTSELTLTMVNKNDSGVFRCEATNILLGVSMNDSQTYKITFNCKLLGYVSDSL